jgi:hypothetical protein
MNGDFTKGMEGWIPRFVYMEDEDPSNICDTRPAPQKDGSALYLWNRRRAYQAPGQDRLPQDVNRVCQAISLESGSWPSIRLRYRIDGDNTDQGFSGAYILAEGYRGSSRLLRIIYSAGMIWVNNWGASNQNKKVTLHHFDLPMEADQWHDCQLSIGSDYQMAEKGSEYQDLKLDRLVLTLGVWNLNDGGEWPLGIYFTDLKLGSGRDLSSSVDGRPLTEKDVALIWWRNKMWPSRNIAGEHRYIIATRPEGTIER